MKTDGKKYLTETQFSNMKRKDKLFDEHQWHNVPYVNYLKVWRQHHHLTIQNISDQLVEAGFSFVPPLIKDIETGKKSPSRDFLYAMSKTFDISIDLIFFPQEHISRILNIDDTELLKKYCDVIVKIGLTNISPVELETALLLIVHHSLRGGTVIQLP